MQNISQTCRNLSITYPKPVHNSGFRQTENERMSKNVYNFESFRQPSVHNFYPTYPKSFSQIGLLWGKSGLSRQKLGNVSQIARVVTKFSTLSTGPTNTTIFRMISLIPPLNLQHPPKYPQSDTIPRRIAVGIICLVAGTRFFCRSEASLAQRGVAAEAAQDRITVAKRNHHA